MACFMNFGSMLKCSFGAAPSPLIVTSCPKHFVGGKPVATEADKGAANIVTFGACTVTPTVPCKPILTQWMRTHTQLKFNGKAVLTDESFIMCSKGGRITFS